MPYANTQRLKVLAVTSAERLPALDHVPTMAAEHGLAEARECGTQQADLRAADVRFLPVLPNAGTRTRTR